MSTQWTFCSSRHPCSPQPPQTHFQSFRKVQLFHFPLQPPQTITSSPDHFFPGLILTPLNFTSHPSPPPQSGHHWRFWDPFLTVLLFCSGRERHGQNLFTAQPMEPPSFEPHHVSYEVTATGGHGPSVTSPAQL